MTIKPLDLKSLPAEAWRPIEPVTGRVFNRISERELENIPVWISLPTDINSTGKIDIPVTLWDYSPFGFAVLHNFNKTNSLNLNPGDKVKVKMDLGHGPLYAECIVQNASIFKQSLRIGLSRRDLTHKAPVMPQIGVPTGECLRLPQQMDIRVGTPNPILFGEWASLKLYGLQPGLKIELLSSDSSLPLFTCQRLIIHLALPTSGDNVYEGEITALERLRGDTIRFQMKPLRISEGLDHELSELLAFEAGISLETLRRYEFPPPRMRARLTFRFVDNMEDYTQVLQLVRDAQAEPGQQNLETTDDGIAGGEDKANRILCAFHEKTLVASATLTFPTSQSSALRSETAFPGNKFPSQTPTKTELLEVNGFSMHRDYQSNDLLRAYFEHVARILVLSDREFILILSDQTQMANFLEIGFQDLQQKGIFLGREHQLIMLARNTILQGHGLKVKVWNNLYAELLQDILDKGLMDFTLSQRLKHKLRLFFRSLGRR